MNVSVHTEGRYAFVELRTPEMATAALQLNGQVRRLAGHVPHVAGRLSLIGPSLCVTGAAPNWLCSCCWGGGLEQGVRCV